VSDLQLGPLAGDDRPIFRPVELERLAGQKRKRHEHDAAARLLFLLPSGLPVASEGRHAIVGAVVAEGGQISVQLLGRPLLFARLPRLLPQHMRQLVGVWVQLAPAVRDVDTSVQPCPSAGICGPCSSTARCAAISLGSRNGLDSASVG
jgi:hypothetical protein